MESKPTPTALSPDPFWTAPRPSAFFFGASENQVKQNIQSNFQENTYSKRS